ncbi:putative fatty acyl-CoA reductase CG5065 [Polistes fuscatus]|uniref:putative fatty acyl-CoA reductase CG5065 n=1 Tax=Polistes fuscatus TaxID=30207 RepID=UPI001CAA2892|nr:putative fatty acyl-CoA reductase CG5065 [Polistes fuscatus]
MSLREWYANREILLTGVTSELGQNLLEKILRTFPDAKVHVIVRTRNNLTNEERIKKIFASAGYARLRLEIPDAISRVKVYEGNLIYDSLGLNEKDRDIIKKKVNVIFHAAGPHDAVFQFAEELPKLETLAAITTIFKHRGHIHEYLQNENTPSVPLTLIRVPLLAPPIREPMPGHVEIFKGITALMVGAGYVKGNPENPAEMIPIDIVTNTLIAAAWDRAQRPKDLGAVVYNTATIGCTWGDLITKGQQAAKKFPYPTFGIRGITAIGWLHWIVVLFLEWLPSLLCDTIVGLFAGKQRIVKEHEKVRKALKSVESIAWRSWKVERNRIHTLHQHLKLEDQLAFPLIVDDDIENYILCVVASVKKYCVEKNILSTFRNIRMLFMIFFGLLIIYFVFYIKSVLVD